jgi:hypothetical protein
LAAGLVAIPTEALAVLVVAVVVTAQVLVALELPGKAIPVVMVVKATGVLVVVAQVKPDLTERRTPQLAAETVFHHRSQAHQSHALAAAAVVTYLGEHFRVVRVAVALAVRLGQVLSRGRQILVVAAVVVVARGQERRAALAWSLFPCQQPTTAA